MSVLCVIAINISIVDKEFYDPKNGEITNCLKWSGCILKRLMAVFDEVVSRRAIP